MAKVLGRVTSALDVPRGPDVVHRINVPASWLEDGARIAFELPRNLSCAACGGGGCDACGRSGAITMRERREPPEVIEVALPPCADPELPPSSGKRGVMVRIPEKGGLPEEGATLPRGVLMLSVRPADEPDPGVRQVLPAPLVSEPAGIGPQRYPRLAIIIAVIVIIWILLLILVRIRGLG